MFKERGKTAGSLMETCLDLTNPLVYQRALHIEEWMKHYRDARRFGDDDIKAGQKADVLTFGAVQAVKL